MAKHKFIDKDVYGFHKSDDTTITVLLNTEGLNEVQDDDGITAISLSEADLKAMLKSITDDREKKIKTRKLMKQMDELIKERDLAVNA